ncbi:DUF4124 domain-containing protein [Ampullimonas aquatilis]|uniref:DUF4124 domain-containing protein n=1 Tax=Ampullimonas aquatilis TaxID=1341549 RepID=UPI003C70A24D
MRDCKQWAGLLWLLSLYLPTSVVAQSAVYRWQDANGRVHYGDQPTVDARKTQMVDVESPYIDNFSTQTPSSAGSTVPDYVIAQKRLVQTMERDRLMQQGRSHFPYYVSSGYRGYTGAYPGYTPGLSVPTAEYCRSYADASCNPDKISGPIYDGPPSVYVRRYGYGRPVPVPTQIIQPDRYTRYAEPRVSLKP